MFLATLFEGVHDGFLELRSSTKPSAFLDLTHPWGPLQPALQGYLDLLNNEPERTPFFGVATRSRVAGGGGNNIGTLTALIADIDFKLRGEQAAAEAISHCAEPPSIIVNTGGGFHCYWLLDTPMHDMARAASLLRRWGKLIPDSDIVFDLPRVLRLPGTLNRKYDPPRETVVEVFQPELRYSADALEETISDLEGVSRRVQEHHGISLLESSSSFAMPETVPQGDRHGFFFRFLRSVQARYGLTVEEAMPLIEAVNETRCDEPLSKSDLQSFARRAARTTHSSEFGR